MKTLSIVTLPSSVISANFIVEHKDFPLSIIPSVYNFHFFKICIVPKGWDYRQDRHRGRSFTRTTFLPFGRCPPRACLLSSGHYRTLFGLRSAPRLLRPRPLGSLPSLPLTLQPPSQPGLHLSPGVLLPVGPSQPAHGRLRAHLCFSTLSLAPHLCVWNASLRVP